MNDFIEIDPKSFVGVVPTGYDLVVAEKGNVEDTALVLYGFDECGFYDCEFTNPVYGFLEH